MKNKRFEYKVNLVPLSIKNQEQAAFRDELNNIPYLLYEVEKLNTGEIIAINKPGGKRNFGRISKDDFMVFIYTPENKSLWLISHKEISDDIEKKYQNDKEKTLLLIKGLYKVCCGAEPDYILKSLDIVDTIGISVETILKVYKWIWGQEDCNYPTGEGRWLSMNGLLEQFNINKEELEK